jgi:NAD(P)-dependent dehydrogenase (short-subunit alcohol dehydrogenase family)
VPYCIDYLSAKQRKIDYQNQHVFPHLTQDSRLDQILLRFHRRIVHNPNRPPPPHPPHSQNRPHKQNRHRNRRKLRHRLLSRPLSSHTKRHNRVHILALDTSSLTSVRAFAETWGDKPIDLLIHNAGITGPPGNQHTTSEGLGTIYATNFAGSFLLTSLLEPNLSPSARVIFTSSTAQYGARPHRIFSLPRLAPQIDAKTSKPTDSGFYADTKFMQSAFAHILQKRFSSSSFNNKRTAHSFVPGYTYTPIFDKTPALPWYMDPFFWALKACTFICIPVDQGAAPGLWLATTDDARVVGEGKGGECWDRCVKRSTAADVLSERTLERMWKQWEVDVGAEWA